MNTLKTTFEEIKSIPCNGVTGLCRYLVALGSDNVYDRIEVYRGDMLCLIVNDIKIASTLEVDNTNWTYSPWKARKTSPQPRTEV